MSTLLLSCACDAAITRLCGAAGCHVSKMHGAGTNCGDVWIALIICATIVAVAFICAGAFLCWKHMEHKAYREAEERKRQWDVEDINRKLNADSLSK